MSPLDITDFSQFERGAINYGGSERKESVRVPNGDGTFSEYMIKFRKRTPFGARFNHVSEYLGSHIFELLGFDVQKTFLGTFAGEEVVACKSFVGIGEQFVPFNEVGESTLDQDKERYQYEYADIMQMLRDNSKLTDVSGTISMFWEMFVVDALVGNFDRHGSNWGFIKQGGAYSLAPVFDNGSCLFPSLVDEDEMAHIMDSEDETAKRVYRFPTSQIRLRGRKSSYYDVIASLEFDECNRALQSVLGRVDRSSIHRLIASVPGISDRRRDFYNHIIEARLELILETSYAALAGRKV
ncbi:HipA domain-containing protein [Gordonibacter urolithinfaciens]|uniref:HipA domain-containing protein n=1 Tax=Gordonibacter urolithinfaciens TaxID=1335613 RepID=UPI001D066324|nr:HipA domain-containing protein [Gordonibacter urolithinfaciens]MCB7084186.1 HipA domain-containing protein [Gordonibacter urolithinfaciens]